MSTTEIPRDFDPRSPLAASGNLGRRQAVSRVVDVVAATSAALAVAVLVLVVGEIVVRGLGSISWSFLTTNGADNETGTGGIAGAIVGTASIVAVATAIAAPIAILTAVYLTEFAGPSSIAGRVLTLTLNLLQGLPTIVVGVFTYGLLIEIKQHQIGTGIDASVALSIVILPLAARTAQEALLRVPASLREAGDALGVERWRTVIGVILPTAAGGILTGTILAVARAAGETAPLLLCDFLFNGTGTSVSLVGHPIPNIPIIIFELSSSSDPAVIGQAWAAALVLFTGILIANVGARMLLARSRRRTGI